jgi:hypothetical protein
MNRSPWGGADAGQGLVLERLSQRAISGAIDAGRPIVPTEPDLTVGKWLERL